MSTNDIRTTLDRAKAWIDKSEDPAAERGKLAKILLPKHDPHTARIRTIEWLQGKRTPRDYGVCVRLVSWLQTVKAVKKTKAPKKTAK